MIQIIDIVVVPVYYPLNDPGEKIIYSSVISEDTMAIGSFYNVSSSSHEGNLFSMFTTVPIGLWIGYVASFVAFVMACCIGSWVLRQRYSALWNIARAFLDQDNFPTTSMFISALSFIVMLCSFLMMSYATSSMSTDLVTIDKAIIIQSYQDIIDRNISTVLVKQMPEYGAFESAPAGSKEAKIFKNAYAFAFGKYKSEKLHSQETVIIGRPHVVTAFARVAVAKSIFPKDGRMLISTDEEAKKYSNVFVLSSKWKGSRMEKLFTQ